MKETDPVSDIDLNKGAFIKLNDTSTDLTRSPSVYMNLLRAHKLVYDYDSSTYYQYFDTGVSWNKAVELCTQLGGHLADCIDEHDSYITESTTTSQTTTASTSTESATTTTSTTPVHPSDKDFGNSNRDGRIDAKDASAVLAYYALASTATGDVPTLREFMLLKKA
ncbi:MAG: hypothetical protein K6A75_04165 [Ruminococcus sp.]|nr:hypothetical protein [Ruminococcus sp.]